MNEQRGLTAVRKVGLPPLLKAIAVRKAGLPTLLAFFIGLVTLAATTSAQRTSTPALTITTEPNAIVWLDEIRRGTTDATGKLA
ncbi:MAG: hypothetical protein WAL47_20765, partial [Pyrinomonadaceae bacterium]